VCVSILTYGGPSHILRQRIRICEYEPISVIRIKNEYILYESIYTVCVCINVCVCAKINLNMMQNIATNSFVFSFVVSWVSATH